MPSRSQRHVRYTQGSDSTGSSRYPGDDFTWDWASNWPSGSNAGSGGPPVTNGLVGHYVADEANFTLSGEDVLQWNDLSPHGRHATHGAGNAPQWTGGPGIEWNATRGLDIAQTPLILTYFLVSEMTQLTPTSLGGYQDLIGDLAVGDSKRLVWHGQSDTDNFFDTPFKFAYADEYELYANDAQGEHFLGAVIANNQRFVGTWYGQRTSSEAYSDQLLNRSAMERGLNARVFEILYYDRELDETERERVKQYLYDKWDIQPDVVP